MNGRCTCQLNQGRITINLEDKKFEYLMKKTVPTKVTDGQGGGATDG